MQKTFDIGLDSLVGGNSAAAPEPEFISTAPQRGTFYLETFGCQMNDHDSEKVAGVLLARGYRQVDGPEAAKVILYNTCSIRERAGRKGFSGFGEWRRGEESEGRGLETVGEEEKHRGN